MTAWTTWDSAGDHRVEALRGDGAAGTTGDAPTSGRPGGGGQLARAEETRAAEAEAWRAILRGSTRHYAQLLEAAREHDLDGVTALASEAHPLCVAAGAWPGGPAFGPWCQRCPVSQEYGSCQPLIRHVVRSAANGNWRAAQLLIVALTLETAATHPSG